VPAKKAIKIAQDLRAKFKDIVGCHASAGIAIAHRSIPLQDLVHAAHDAESRAKKTYGRNALAISIYKRSGEILEWGCKWESSALEIYKTLSEISEQKVENIKRFPYKLADLLIPYALEGELDDMMRNVLMAEFEHAINQTEGMKGKLDLGKVREYLRTTSTKPTSKDEEETFYPRAEDFLNLFMAETFINRPREGEDD
jgi:CRISPR/Cas system-associated protein Cas10 (large subunit of type III CRISPR-Cas system)